MKDILRRLFDHKTLSYAQAKEVITSIASGRFNDTEVGAFITTYLMRSIRVEELEGFRDGLLDLSVPIDLGPHDTLDIVGTGGDGKNTFNISTIACFIAAGAGIKVTKHGNYGATSISGSSNVMEELGYQFTSDSTQLKKQLDEANLCFLHAPLFHPALKTVAHIRKNLGFRTFFNMLGPLVNPARPRFQLIGVYNSEMARVYSYVLQRTEQPFTVIHTLDGYDEISLTEDTKMITRETERVLSPEALGKRRVVPADLYGGSSVEEAARIFLSILEGRGSWSQNAVVLANAAAAMQLTGRYSSYDAAMDAAIESLEGGKALQVLKVLKQNNE